MRRGPGLLLSLLGLSTLLLLLGGVPGQEAGTACDIDAGFFLRLQTGGGNERNFMWDGVEIRCDDGTHIWADSAVVFQATNFTQLFRNVRFIDGETELTADRAHHFSRESRLVAWGDAVLTNEAEGSVVTGDTIVINQANARRETNQLTASGGRPRALLFLSRGEPAGPEDTTGVAQETSGVGDSLDVLQDTTTAGDSLAAPPDSGAAAFDSLAVEEVLEIEEALDTTDVEEVVEIEEALDTAGVEPEAVLAPVEAEGAAAAPDTSRVPYDIVANRIYIEGSEYLRATGSVEITRDSLEAFADSVEYDRRAERLFLRGDARIKEATYDLTAGTVSMLLPGEEIREVVARGDAVLTAEQVLLRAPQIHVYLTEGVMDRLVALGRADSDSETDTEAPTTEGEVGEPSDEEDLPPTRPEALAEDFLLIADSIEVLSPGEVLQQVFAAGDARGESLARDSINTEDTPEIIRRDWVAGDTIIATFVPVSGTGARGGDSVPPEPERLDSLGNRMVAAQPADTTGKDYELERLVARVNARSLYRLEASDTTAAAVTDTMAAAVTDTTMAEEEKRLAVHYVTGSTIIIHLKDGEIDRMEVEDAKGIHMEPIRRRGTNATSQEDRRGGN